MATKLPKFAALATAATVVVLSAAPAHAATVAQADASAIDLQIGGNSALTAISDTYTSTHDGTTETTTGTNKPVVEALGAAAVLEQDANSFVEGRVGKSNAVARTAGVGLDLAALDLGTVDLTGGSLLEDVTGLDAIITQVQNALQQQVLPAAQDIVDQVLAGTGLNVQLGLNGVEARCSATPGQASGDATLADAGLTAAVGGQQLDLVDLPVDPPPNTHVVSDLSVVVDAVNNALRAEFAALLEGQLSALGSVITDQVLQTINDNLIAQVAPQLAPLEQNVLDIILNEQTRPEDGRIEVTALRIKVLPAAADAIGFPLIDGFVSHVGCGPNSRVAAPASPSPTPPPPAGPTDVPTLIPSGQASTPGVGGEQDGMPLYGVGALGVLILLSVAAGVAGFRRSLGS